MCTLARRRAEKANPGDGVRVRFSLICLLGSILKNRKSALEKSVTPFTLDSPAAGIATASWMTRKLVVGSHRSGLTLTP